MAGHDFITGLGRSIEPRLRSHRIVFAGALTSSVLYAGIAAINDRPMSDAFIAGLVVFIAWAIGRELDPDRPNTGAWAMPFAFAAAVYDMPSALAAAIAMIGLRVVAGTIGARVTWLDVVALALIGFGSGSEQVLWIVGLVIGMWLLSAPEVGSLRYLALGSLVVGLFAGAWFAEPASVEITQDAYLLAALGGVVMMLAMKPAVMISNTDARTGQIDVSRIGLARKAAGSFLMWAAVMGGVAGFWMISPVLAALTATAIAKWFSPGA
jgi:hypothetical protein